MDKRKMHTPNLVKRHIEEIGRLFPNTITEIIENGQVRKAIDFDLLRQELSDEIVEGTQERYQFTWPGKKRSILLANAPIAKTLRPYREESVDFDNTENLYIEGDNLDVLKLLQKTYLGKVKMIYIDPPYNTGNDFIYNDNFSKTTYEYLETSSQLDENSNLHFENTESNGRFHTNWLNMIYPRLKLAKNLLSDDGAIFISIDDNEVHNLINVCNEIFGEANFVSIFSWIKTSNPPSLGSKVRDNLEYVLCYEKNFSSTNKLYGRESNQKDSPLANASNRVNTVTIPAQSCVFTSLSEGTVPKGYKASGIELLDDIKVKYGKNENDFQLAFRSKWGQDNIHSEIKSGTYFLIKDHAYFSIRYVKGNIDYVVPDKFLDPAKFNVKDNGFGRKELEGLLGKVGFDYPKNTALISTLINMYTKTGKSGIILDFFSGSGTTAHTVMKLNAEDGGNRKFIMVQIPEKTEEKSEAYKAGYKNICEIGKERIRRASKKIAEENPEAQFDGGFRVLKCDGTNIKEDRAPEDLLFQVMLDLGVAPSSKIEETIIGKNEVFNVADNFLIACFDENIDEETIKAIAKKKPYYFVMRDSSGANKSISASLDRLFAAYSPETVRKVL